MAVERRRKLVLLCMFAWRTRGRSVSIRGVVSAQDGSSSRVGPCSARLGAHGGRYPILGESTRSSQGSGAHNNSMCLCNFPPTRRSVYAACCSHGAVLYGYLLYSLYYYVEYVLCYVRLEVVLAPVHTVGHVKIAKDRPPASKNRATSPAPRLPHRRRPPRVPRPVSAASPNSSDRLQSQPSPPPPPPLQSQRNASSQARGTSLAKTAHADVA